MQLSLVHYVAVSAVPISLDSQVRGSVAESARGHVSSSLTMHTWTADWYHHSTAGRWIPGEWQGSQTEASYHQQHNKLIAGWWSQRKIPKFDSSPHQSPSVNLHQFRSDIGYGFLFPVFVNVPTLGVTVVFTEFRGKFFSKTTLMGTLLRGMVKTATGQNGDKSKRRQTKTATGPK